VIMMGEGYMANFNNGYVGLQLHSRYLQAKWLSVMRIQGLSRRVRQKV